jgi:branched-chain amino acid transport system permease protein
MSATALFGQLLLGLINGSFYAMLSLGLAIIFGLLGIVNAAQGAFYMLGAFIAWMLLHYLGIGYWWAFVLAPFAVAIFGMILERVLIARVYTLDHLYGLLLTLGLFQIIQGMFVHWYGTSGQPYDYPYGLTGGYNLGFMFMPAYRAWVVVASLACCFGTWYAVEKTRLGAYLRAATENPTLVRAFGINVPRLVTLAFGGGVALAGLAGVLAAPIYQVNPLMGGNILITVFAVVVIGGFGSILGSIVTGLALGVLEGLSKVFYPEASNMVIFVIMILVLMVKPAGLFGRERQMAAMQVSEAMPAIADRTRDGGWLGLAVGIAILVAAPFLVYPAFLTELLCMALFACAFNLLIGGGGLLSFGHAAFFGGGAYIAAETAKAFGFSFELALLSGTACATFLGFLFGIIAIRRQGLFFAMITLALTQGVYFLALRLPFTNSEDGIQAVPRGWLFGLVDLKDNFAMYYVTAAIFLAGYLLVARVWKSPFGQVLRAIKNNEPRMISLGYPVDRYKLMNFVLSAALAGVAGSLKAIALGLATLTDVDFTTSAAVVLMVLLGGMGTLLGPVVGAILTVSMDEYLAGIGVPVPVVIGVIFVVIILVFRRGIVGEAFHYWNRWQARAAPSYRSG